MNVVGDGVIISGGERGIGGVGRKGIAVSDFVVGTEQNEGMIVYLIDEDNDILYDEDNVPLLDEDSV